MSPRKHNMAKEFHDMGKKHLEARNFAEAEKSFADVLKLRPKNAIAHHNLAIARHLAAEELLAKGNRQKAVFKYSEAAEQYRKAMDLSPRDPETYKKAEENYKAACEMINKHRRSFPGAPTRK